MDDNLSIKSSESLTTSGEYEIVTDSNVTTPMESQHREIMPLAKEESSTTTAASKSPTLDIANNRDLSDLQKEMTEAIREHELEKVSKIGSKISQKSLTLPLTSTSRPALVVPDKSEFSAMSKMKSFLRSEETAKKSRNEVSSTEHTKVGQSVFYDCIDASPFGGIEKQDDMKPERSDTDGEDIDQGCTIFSGVTYLGAANINAPKSESDVYRIMRELNSGASSVGLKISISIPNCSEGLVVLHDAESNTVIATYEIQSIILYYRGPIESVENGCFAFTWLHGEALFQCHVFRCQISEAVNQVSACFQKAFQHYPQSMTCSLTSAMDSNMMNSVTSDLSGNPLATAGYEFIVSLEIRERVTKNSFSAVPRDRMGFRLRANMDKEVFITVKQTPSNVLPPLLIERCFGVLLSPGKLMRQADMQLIDLVTMGYQLGLPTSATATSNDNPSALAPVTQVAPAAPLCLYPYCIRAEWKVKEKAFEQLNSESHKTFLTVAVDIVIRGIQEPVRFVIETPVNIQSHSEIRIMDHFISKRPMTLRFYLQLQKTDEFNWKVSSIDPSEEILEQPQQSASSSSSYLLKLGMNNLSRIVRSSSIASIEDDCPTDYSSDGDEPLLSGTGEVSKDCSQDTLDDWDPIFKEWDGEKRPKNLSPLVRMGVPEALREKIWQKLANVEGKVEMNDMYKTLLTKETKCEGIIQSDIHRTFPAHKCFKETGGSGQDALFKVSKAYAVYDSEVGYCQGLSFIAASLLLHMPEEDAFCVLVALMYDYGLRELYKPGFEVLHLRLYQLDRLIKDQLPKLHEHFVACCIETHMYASPWFLTLFTARFPLCFVFHVLDVFLLDGMSLLFQVAITLLSICESDLRSLDFDGILKYMRVTLPKKCRSSSQARRVMKMACERKIKKLKQYEDEFLLKKQHSQRFDKEAQIYENKFGEERRKLQTEIDALHLKLQAANERAEEKERKHTGIIQDYKQIIQRLEQDITTLNESLASLMNTVLKCKQCAAHIDIGGHLATDCGEHTLNKNANEAPLGPLDPLNGALQRVRELELELAQAKLAQVEAECKNQDLNHQLSTAITEMQTNRNSWQPWLSKTFNSLQEKVTTRSSRDGPTATFQSYTNHRTSVESVPSPTGTNQEFKVFNTIGGSPKLSAKFQAARLRNSIDSLRNIVVLPMPGTGTDVEYPRVNNLNDNMKYNVTLSTFMQNKE